MFRVASTGKLIINEVDQSFGLFSSQTIYTIILNYIHMSYGVSIATYGPAYVDLKYILNTSMYEISMITLFLSFGYLTGSLTGFFFKYVNRQLVLIALTACMAVSNGLVPYAHSVWQLYLFIFTYALGAGAFINSKNVWLVEIWQHNSGPVLQICGFMYGIGNILGPLIDRPFLTGENLKPIGDNSSGVLLTNLSSIDTKDIETRRSKLKTPFLISGIIQMMGPVMLTVMYFVKKYENNSKNVRSTNNEKMTKLLDRKTRFRTIVIILSAIFLAFYVSTEAIYTQFAATYFQYIPLHWSAQSSAAVVSAMSLTYTISIGISSLVSVRIGPKRIIVFYFGILFIALTVLVFGQNSSVLLWTGSLTMSFGLSPIYPSIYALVGQYMRLTNRIGTILFFCSETLNLLVPFVLGTYIDKYPKVFIWSILTNISTIFIIFLVILCIIRNADKSKNEIQTKHEFAFTITSYQE